MDNSPRSPVAVREALLRARARLREAGFPDSDPDAGLLLAHILKVPREALVLDPDKTLTDNDILPFEELVARRAQHEPIAYILGEKEFWSLAFCVTRDTLIPRPDSETLVEAALKRVRTDKTRERAKAITLLDIGTGTGCLLVALLKELPEASGVGVDINERALRVAEENARRHEVTGRTEFILSHWCDAIDRMFDLIISNPPYVALRDKDSLMPDVLKFEPEAALFAGEDGLDAYRALAPRIAKRLKPGGIAVLEVGEGQAKQVSQMLREQQLEVHGTEKDLAGVERCVVAKKRGQ